MIITRLYKDGDSQGGECKETDKVKVNDSVPQ